MNEELSFRHPLASRYASREMRERFSEQRRHVTWRRLWIALAEAQRELGLPIEERQIEAMRRAVDQIDWEVVRAQERAVRHDVMAHIHAFAERCPEARPILHLGATSCFVTDNADLVLYREALDHVRRYVAATVDHLADFARRHARVATLAFTHFQPAQPTTVGKRACLWIQDLLYDWEELDRLVEWLPFRGAKGTTGTQASYLQLFGGDHAKVEELDRRVAEKMGFAHRAWVTGQTYPRKIDHRILSVLSAVAQSASKFAVDVRLLAHRRELEEPFEEQQVGSSAMAYKRNPMRTERMTSIARYLLGLPENAAHTAANQWLERTLDDSAIRRIVLPEGFLAADALLQLAMNVSRGLVVRAGVVERNLREELPFMITERVLMATVERGGDRQEAHERIRVHAHAAAARLKDGATDNDLVERLRTDPVFRDRELPWDELMRPEGLYGRAPEQTEWFLAEVVGPRLASAQALLGARDDIVV